MVEPRASVDAVSAVRYSSPSVQPTPLLFVGCLVIFVLRSVNTLVFRRLFGIIHFTISRQLRLLPAKTTEYRKEKAPAAAGALFVLLD